MKRKSAFSKETCPNNTATQPNQVVERMISLLLLAAEYIERQGQVQEQGQQRPQMQKRVSRCKSNALCKKAKRQWFRDIKGHRVTTRKPLRPSDHLEPRIAVGDIVSIAAAAWDDHIGAPEDQLAYVVYTTAHKMDYVVLSGVSRALRREIVRDLREFVTLYRGRNLMGWADIVSIVQWLPLSSPHILRKIGRFV